MTDLLPEGFRDLLPGEAEHVALASERAMAVFAQHGYARVQPPMAEFESSLETRDREGAAPNRLRLTDPLSQRTLAMRSDMTVQVGRIASTRLANAARPLRLAYSGQVLRLRPGQLNPDREFAQVGAEIVGSDNVAAARESVDLAIAALEASGVTGMTVDFTLPDLLATLTEAGVTPTGASREAIRHELDMKDAGALQAMGAEAFLPLIEATGPLDRAIERLESFDTTGALASRIAGLREIGRAVAGRAQITLDPTERHGFEYQSWFGFTLFAEGYGGAIGRGGTYRIAHEHDESDEPACGFSLFPDRIVASGQVKAEARKRLYLPLGHDAEVAREKRAEGWQLLAALDEGEDPVALGCTHKLDDSGSVSTLDTGLRK